MELPRKPSEMFDRDDEWNDLARFAVDDAPGATLGVVSGRRRQGKTMVHGRDEPSGQREPHGVEVHRFGVPAAQEAVS